MLDKNNDTFCPLISETGTAQNTVKEVNNWAVTSAVTSPKY